MYPPIDSHFYALGASSGMTDAEIEEDWHTFIDGLNEFHAEREKDEANTPPMPDVTHKTMRDLAQEILSKLPFKSEPKVPEEKHAPS